MALWGLGGVFSVYPALEVNELGLRTLLVTRALSFVCRDDILLVFCLAIYVYFCFMEREFVSLCLAIFYLVYKIVIMLPNLKSSVLVGSDCRLWFFVTYFKTFGHAS